MKVWTLYYAVSLSSYNTEWECEHYTMLSVCQVIIQNESVNTVLCCQFVKLWYRIKVWTLYYVVSLSSYNTEWECEHYTMLSVCQVMIQN